MKFWNVVTNEDTGQNELRIDGQIQMEQGFWDWLFDKPDRSATGLEKAINSMSGDISVWINSNGGECFAASVIYTALRNYSKTKGRVTVKVDGTAISAASVIAMAGDEILMSPTSVMMIHNPLTQAEGEVKDMEKAISILKTVKETIMNAYCSKTRLTRDEVSQLMDQETWMSVNEAIERGFATGKLFDDDSPTNMLTGARAVYNAVSQSEVESIVELLKKQNEASNQHNSDEDADFLMLKNQMELEEIRF